MHDVVLQHTALARHRCRRRTTQESSVAAQESATELVDQLAVISTERTELELQLTQRTTE
jgi:hypothetical protein